MDRAAPFKALPPYLQVVPTGEKLLLEKFWAAVEE
jgi:hypothetical protein